jgi:hypothetical protein
VDIKTYIQCINDNENIRVCSVNQNSQNAELCKQIEAVYEGEL